MSVPGLLHACGRIFWKLKTVLKRIFLFFAIWIGTWDLQTWTTFVKIFCIVILAEKKQHLHFIACFSHNNPLKFFYIRFCFQIHFEHCCIWMRIFHLKLLQYILFEMKTFFECIQQSWISVEWERKIIAYMLKLLKNSNKWIKQVACEPSYWYKKLMRRKWFQKKK